MCKECAGLGAGNWLRRTDMIRKLEPKPVCGVMTERGYEGDGYDEEGYDEDGNSMGLLPCGRAGGRVDGKGDRGWRAVIGKTPIRWWPLLGPRSSR